MDTPLPAYKGTEPYVFVCYSHADSAVVYPEMRWLQAQGVHLWYDAGISGGAVWRAEIADAIRGAARLVVYLSKASIASTHCLREIDYALDQGVPVLPVYLDDVALPSGLDLSLNRVQALRRAGTSAYQTTLLDALGRRETVPRPASRTRLRTGLLTGGFVALLGIAVAGGWLMRPVDDATVALDRSISVPPFDVIGEGDVAPVAVTLREEVVGLLAGYQELRMVDESEAASYQLRGSVQASGEPQRIRVRLMRTQDGQTVWSEAFEAPKVNLARSISRYARLQLLRDHECESIREKAARREAADALCAALAVTYRNDQGGNFDNETQRAYAERAILLDPMLPESYWLAAPSYLDRNDVRAARSLLEQGLERVPEDPALLGVTAWLLSIGRDLNYALGEARLERAIELAPLDPRARWYYGALGMSALHQGDAHRAVDWYRQAVGVFDADGRIWSEYALALYAAARYQDAITATDEGFELIQEGLYYDVLVATKVGSLVALGDVDRARRVVDDLRPAGAMSVFSLVTLGDRSAIESWLREFGSGRATHLQLAFAHMALGDADSALRWLHRMIDVREFGTTWAVRSHPGLEPLRRDPRWALLMQHLEREEAKGAAGVLYEGPPDTPGVGAASW